MYSVAPSTAGHVTLYVDPASALAGALICGAAGMVHCGAAITVTVAIAVAPPADAGNETVIVALPGETPEMTIAAERPPAGMATDGATLATAGLDEVTVSVALLTNALLVSAVIDVLLPASICAGGVSVSEGTGIWIEPLTSASSPLASLSFVADEPATSVSCVVAPSSVSEMLVPAAADDDSVKTRCATRLPGGGAFNVKGIGLLDG
jgi:hypothetical protein